MNKTTKNQGFSRRPNGLTSNDWKQLFDLMTKANDSQVTSIINIAIGEQERRRMRRGE